MTDLRYYKTSIRRRAVNMRDAREAFEKVIRDAHADGMTTRAIATEAGLSHQRIHQIIHGR